jgi:hypothetical protein
MHPRGRQPERPLQSQLQTSGTSLTARYVWFPNILAGENLNIEDMSSRITSYTFSVWKINCFLSKDTIDALQGVRYAIVHRYSSPTDRNAPLDTRSTEVVNLAVACLALIRPTRRSHASNVIGVIKPDGMLDPQQFNTVPDLAEVPEIQKLFTVRTRDIDLLRAILPEFISLYQKDNMGRVKDEYEPLRMAVQLYEQAYAISYWKARHILWWSAIEALYGNNEDAAMARIYALFGSKNPVDGSDVRSTKRETFPPTTHPRLTAFTHWVKWCLSSTASAMHPPTDKSSRHPLRPGCAPVGRDNWYRCTGRSGYFHHPQDRH